MKRDFAGIPVKKAGRETAAFLLQSIPYDGTSTWGKGADKGFERFMDSLDNMEIYDIETDSEAYLEGVYILDPITEDASPEAVFEAVYASTRDLLKEGKTLTFFGGEHSISIGIIKAFYEKFPDITIVQLDAHADLRESYLGSLYNHACALHDASRHANLIQVGIRSMDSCEKEWMDKGKCYFAHDIVRAEGSGSRGEESRWMDDAVSKMTQKVYITIDLDVFDPSIMPSTGTPEPGGLDWMTVTAFLKKIFQNREVLGWDIVELAPIDGLNAPNFLAAKLYYKLLGYKVCYNGK